VAGCAQTGRLSAFFDLNAGAGPPMPVSPWQLTHPACSKTSAPSLAVPRPGGSSAPVGLIEISRRRISSAVGVRPTPYEGEDCANAGLPNSTRSGTNATSLSEPIGHAPVLGDLPRQGTLAADETYALTAYLLVLNKVIPEDTVLDRESLPKVKMPIGDDYARLPEWKHGTPRLKGYPY
jgi:hypothetical protein